MYLQLRNTTFIATICHLYSQLKLILKNWAGFFFFPLFLNKTCVYLFYFHGHFVDLNASLMHTHQRKASSSATCLQTSVQITVIWQKQPGWGRCSLQFILENRGRVAEKNFISVSECVWLLHVELFWVCCALRIESLLFLWKWDKVLGSEETFVSISELECVCSEN